MRKKNLSSSLKVVFVVFVLFFVSGAFFLYLNGYRLEKAGVVFPVRVNITIPLSGTTVYVDNLKKNVTSNDNEIISFTFPSGTTHQVLLSKIGYWPWKKDFDISKGMDINVEAFLVIQNTTGVAIGGEDPEYEKIKQLVRESSVPGSTTKIISEDKKIAVWLEDGKIMAEWLGNDALKPSFFCITEKCDKSIVILSVSGTLHNLEFYKNRSDVLLISLNNVIGALEVDARGTQNFQPIYTGAVGSVPHFVRSANGTIFINDAETLMEIGM